jgi:hypothetical protein
MFSKNANDSNLKQWATDIANAENKMEMLRIEQANQLRSICNPAQLEKFEILVKEIRDYLKPDNK